jgi:Sel1 repeat-containing protein
MEASDGPEAWKLLREMCHDVVALRRGDHSAEWLRLEEERVKLLKNAGERKKEKLEVEEDPPLPPMSEEEKERHYAQIFGFDLESHPMYQKKNPFAPVSEPADTPAPPPEAANPPSDPSAGAVPAKQEEAVVAKTQGLRVRLGLRTEEENPETVELQRVTKLAEKGDAYSAYCLGVYYQDGFRVPKDLAKAREWLSKAASQGIGGAKVQLHALLMRFGDGDLNLPGKFDTRQMEKSL